MAINIVYFGSNACGQCDILDELQSVGNNTTLCLHTGEGPLAVNLQCDDSVRKIAETLEKELDTVDMLIFDGRMTDARDEAKIEDHPDWDEAQMLYNKYFLGFGRLLHVMLPIMRKGGLKRVCVLTDKAEEVSVNLSRETAGYGKRIATGALHMFSKEMFNQLTEEGFTMRIYCADGDWDYIAEYFLSDRNFLEEEAFRSDERRFVMRTRQGTEIPW